VTKRPRSKQILIKGRPGVSICDAMLSHCTSPGYVFGVQVLTFDFVVVLVLRVVENLHA
jgi:hypothetical protein